MENEMSAQRAADHAEHLRAQRGAGDFPTPPETPSTPSGIHYERLRLSLGSKEDHAPSPTHTQDEDWDQTWAMLSRRLEVPSPTAVEDVSEDCAEVQVEADTEGLLACIQRGINYTRSRLSDNLPITQTTRFEIPLQTATYTPSDTHVSALALLRASAAIVILKSPTRIVFELGMPNPYIIAEGAGVRLDDVAQWWADKSTAEIKAGQFADQLDVRKAESKLKELATKRIKKGSAKTVKEKEIESKLQEGLRRQEVGLSMAEDDDGFDEDGDYSMEDEY
jgi:hypothetical protein